MQVTGELKDIQIRLVSNPNVWQTIDIVVVDIPEAYGLLLSRDWSRKLNGYFTMDWSHLWLPYKGVPNQIQIDRELHMKYMVTDLETQNKPLASSREIPEIYCFDSFFGNFPVRVAPEENKTDEGSVMNCENENKNDEQTEPSRPAEVWTLHFDGSKCKEGTGAGCILKNPKGDKSMIA